MLPLILLVCFLAVPIVEIYVIIQVGQVIGALPTVALLLAESLLGAWIVRREGLRAWRKLQDTLRNAVMPDRELANAALVLIGGTLLLTPGFVTDAFGFLFVLPFTRPLVRGALGAVVRRRLEARVRAYGASARGSRTGPAGAGAADTTQGPSGHRVIRGDVVDDDKG